MAYRDSTFPSWMRWLFASFPIGSVFGIPVRVHITTLLVPLLSLSYLRDAGFEGSALAFVFGSLALLYLFVLTHELGHIYAGRRVQIDTRHIMLSPLGGLAHMESPAPTPRWEALIALAGPATHLLWLALLYPLSRTWHPGGLTEGFVGLAIQTNFWLMLFNLLPFFPMDGGRVLRGLLSLRWHPNKASLVTAWIGMFGAGGFVFYGLFFRRGFSAGLLIAIGISNFIACQREKMAARTGDGPYGEPRQPWESDPEAWKRGPAASPKEEAREVRSERRRAEQARRGDEERQRTRAELDRLLERVSEVGMDGLSADEKRALERLSKELSKDSPSPDRR